jgi:hypothetical protein
MTTKNRDKRALLNTEAPSDGRRRTALQSSSPVAIDAVDDALAFILRSGTSAGDVGEDRAKAKVLEVAEIWGDTVLDVRHFTPKAGRINVGASTGYRWRFLGMPIGWVSPAFAKFAWLLAPTLSEAREEARNDFYVPPEDLPEDDFALFEYAGGGYVFNWSDQWSGFVDIGDARLTFHELIESGQASPVGPGRYQVPVGDDTRVVADLGNVVFFGQNVPQPKRVQPKMTSDLDYPFLGAISLMSFLFLLIGLVYLSADPPQDTEVMAVPDRFVELMLEQPKPEPQMRDSKPETDPDAGEGAKAKADEGKVGKTEGKMDKAKGAKVAMQKKRLDKEIAEHAGVLGALRDGADLDGVFAASMLNADLAGSIGGLIGAKGTPFGSNGLSTRGSGLGNNGTADDIGGLGTRGVAGGDEGYGLESGDHGIKTDGGIGRIGGAPIVVGALDRSLVDAVIKRHMNQIRHCYQRELTRDPSLAGKVTVNFVIARDGTVSKASTKSSTMNNRVVEGCINGRFMRFQFPPPKGGGIVLVSYPFIFSQG